MGWENEHQLSDQVTVINDDGGYSLILAAYRWACGSSQLAWSKGQQQLAAVLYSSRGPHELSEWLCYNDSTINRVLGIYYYY